MKKRYCLEKIISIDSKYGVETWKRLNICHDNIAVFNNFLVEGYRIYDMKNKKEVNRKIEDLTIYDISRNEGV